MKAKKTCLGWKSRVPVISGFPVERVLFGTVASHGRNYGFGMKLPVMLETCGWNDSRVQKELHVRTFGVGFVF